MKMVRINYVTIGYPIMIIGAGRDKTTIHGGGFRIAGMKEEGKEVELKDMTIEGSSRQGLHNNNGLSWLCKRMTIILNVVVMVCMRKINQLCDHTVWR